LLLDSLEDAFLRFVEGFLAENWENVLGRCDSRLFFLDEPQLPSSPFDFGVEDFEILLVPLPDICAEIFVVLRHRAGDEEKCTPILRPASSL
jgi:hypothetical protein